MDPEQGPQQGPEEPPLPAQAFADGRRSPWWAGPQIRLGVLLTCLALAVLALLDSRGALRAPAGSTRSAWACQGVTAPEAARPGASGRASLRAAVLAVFADRTGRLYEQGAGRHVEPLVRRPAGARGEQRRRGAGRL